MPTRSSNATVSVADTANELGLHDQLRHGTRSLAADIAPSHPIQQRLELVSLIASLFPTLLRLHPADSYSLSHHTVVTIQWEETEENLHLTLQRQLYGLHAPIRRLMERDIVANSALPQTYGTAFLKPTNLSLDILLGKDETIEIKDVLIGSYLRNCYRRLLN